MVLQAGTAGHHGGPHLLEDAWGATHEHGFDLSQAFDNPVDAPIDGRGEAVCDLAGDERLAEDVTEREPQVLEVGFVDDLPVLRPCPLVDPGCVIEPDPFRLACRPGGVDEGGEGLVAGGSDGLVDDAGVLVQEFRAQALQLRVGDDPVIQLHPAGVDDDDRVDGLGQGRARVHLRQL